MCFIKRLSLALTIAILLSGCSGGESNQEELQTSFSSYDEAIYYVEHSYLFINDSVNTSKSSWVYSANYYYEPSSSCGYGVFNLSGNDYIHKCIPKYVWEGFKIADSFGSYYNSYVKGNYTLNLQ